MRFNFYLIKYIFLFIYRLRQEFGIIKKLGKQSITNNTIQNERTNNISQNTDSNDNNELKSETENNQNQFECSHTSYDSPRCRNMSGNYIIDQD